MVRGSKWCVATSNLGLPIKLSKLQILYEGHTADAAFNDKHGFETQFENLFQDRTPEELLAIKKKYGATGDLLEAEARIKAIAQDMVRHYLEHIFPNGFKAQVVCHSKLAAVRYQKAIAEALAATVEQLTAHPSPDLAYIKKVAFLKAEVIISEDSTNEAGYITAVRKQAKVSDALQNFCKPFHFDDPDQTDSGIAFLIVCDMLLTGFDAPIEQVMYLDKKIKEHSLLQAIARTNRVQQGKQRGYVVDYIGLTENLTDALTLYATADEQQELALGLKNIASEMPILSLRLKAGRFYLHRRVIEQGGKAAAQQAFKAYFTVKGQQRFSDRVNYFALKVGVQVTGIKIKDLGYRWGSCGTKGMLNFHWACMMAPLKIIDYIVVHELCHLHHRNHSDAFWNEVDKVMPDYAERKEWLRKNGASLTL